MRYYLIEDSCNLKFDLINVVKISDLIFQMDFQFSDSTSDKDLEKKNFRIYIRKSAEKYFVSSDGITWEKTVPQSLFNNLIYIEKNFKVYRGFRPSGLSQGQEGALYTKMPGKVVKIFVGPGEQIKKGQTLLILESMKMENEIKSYRDGHIKSVNVSEGNIIEQGKLLIELES